MSDISIEIPYELTYRAPVRKINSRIIRDLNGQTYFPSIILIVGILCSNYLNFVHLYFIILQPILEYTEKKTGSI